jgi:hypothetical protein
VSKRATAAFLISITGAAYQLTSLFVAAVLDRNTSFYLYNLGYETLFFTSFIVIWSASHILEDWKGRITWPSIILVIGIANLSTIILSFYSQTTSPIFLPSNTPSAAAISSLIAGPLLIVIGGILGLSAVRQYSREHARAVIAHP